MIQNQNDSILNQLFYIRWKFSSDERIIIMPVFKLIFHLLNGGNMMILSVAHNEERQVDGVFTEPSAFHWPCVAIFDLTHRHFNPPIKSMSVLTEWWNHILSITSLGKDSRLQLVIECGETKIRQFEMSFSSYCTWNRADRFWKHKKINLNSFFAQDFVKDFLFKILTLLRQNVF